MKEKGIRIRRAPSTTAAATATDVLSSTSSDGEGEDATDSKPASAVAAAVKLKAAPHDKNKEAAVAAGLMLSGWRRSLLQFLPFPVATSTTTSTTVVVRSSQPPSLGRSTGAAAAAVVARRSLLCLPGTAYKQSAGMEGGLPSSPRRAATTRRRAQQAPEKPFLSLSSSVSSILQVTQPQPVIVQPVLVRQCIHIWSC